MTEITAKRSWLTPRISGPRYVIDPVAFFVALFGGPLLVTAATFWALGIPVVALVMGGPVYLVLGTPILLLHLRRNVGSADTIVPLAGLTMIIGVGALGVVAGLFDLPDLITIAFVYGLFGSIFSMLWAAAFAWIYNRLRSDLSRQPL